MSSDQNDGFWKLPQEWATQDGVSLTFDAQIEGYCSIEYPDGVITEATAPSNEEAAAIVLEKLKTRHNREFKLTWADGQCVYSTKKD